MKRVKHGLYLLEAGGFVNAYLVEGPQGLTLVDTGTSRSAEALAAEIVSGGFTLRQIEQILITHHHFDHAGGAAYLLERRSVKALAHPDDIPAVQGRRPWPKGLWRKARRLVTNLWFPYRPVESVAPVAEGEALRLLPGWQVVHSPGHTAGSLSLFEPEGKILICGDALSNRGGALSLSPAQYNQDQARAAETARKLAALEPDVLCCGHGPVIASGAARALNDAAGRC